MLTNVRLLIGNDNESQGTQYNLTSVNRWAEVEQLEESINQETMMVSHYR